MQIKTTVRHHVTPTRMDMIKNNGLTSVDEDVKKLEPSHVAGGNVRLVQPLWKTVCQFLRVLTMELTYGTAIPLLDIHP